MSLVVVSCSNEKMDIVFSDYKIEQELCTECRYSTCNSLNGCFATYVWKGNDMLASWYDHPKTVTDSLKKLRILWAKNFIDNYKTYDTVIVYKPKPIQ